MPHYTDELRAAVLADVLTGNSIRFVARKHGVPVSTVRGWRDGAGVRLAGEALTEQRERIGRKLLGLTEGYIDAVGSLLAQAGDADWRSRQSGSDLAVFLGVIADKGYRLLAALRPADDSAQTYLESSAAPADPEG